MCFIIHFDNQSVLVMVGSIGMRRSLISSGDWSDGLERQGSNPWPTTKQSRINSVVECLVANENVIGSNPISCSTKFKENNHGAVIVFLGVVGLLYWLDRFFK